MVSKWLETGSFKYYYYAFFQIHDSHHYEEVLPFKGTRYSVIFYQLEPAFAVDRTSTEEGGGGVGGAAAAISTARGAAGRAV